MIFWIRENISTLITAFVLAVIVFIITVKMIKDKKQGKGQCSCGCSGCAMRSTCHEKNEDQNAKDKTVR